MKKQGFTLIEALIVISVLGIIALITIPIVTEVEKRSRKSTAELSFQNLKKAAELYYYNNHLTGGVITSLEFKCGDGVCSNGVDVLKIDGKAPESGTVMIDQNGNITMDSIMIEGYLCAEVDEQFICEKN